ncbi:putative metalloprotease CJM1_0395 family protein [Saccharospirillum mangrovi]|uniref:putative metalloprotease CJM1_0395 family protein n=1 Tax=Saccharospirillum mangrovi TaxID=2161747 RepID=UPI0013008EBA|nr:putative metalloprotease CJM1_0395 family protein [Saccharospirillum mangrovi]
MSTVSGLTPTTVTPSVGPLSDPAQQAQLRRRNETAVFSPVEESEASSPSQNRSDQSRSDQNGRDVRQQATVASTAPSTTPQTTAPQSQNQNAVEPVQPSQAVDNSDNQSDSEARALAERRVEERVQKEQLETIRDLARRDREVRTHEQAHQTIGGQYAGSMKLDYTTGPDGRRYAVSGEVPIDLSPIPGNPEATRAKALQVRQAALAPSEPSNQDRSVAAQATQLALQAQVELRQQERVQSADNEQEVQESRSIEQESEARTEQSGEQQQAENATEADNAQERLDAIFNQSKTTNEQSLVREQYSNQQAEVGRNLDFIV